MGAKRVVGEAGGGGWTRPQGSRLPGFGGQGRLLPSLRAQGEALRHEWGGGPGRGKGA